MATTAPETNKNKPAQPASTNGNKPAQPAETTPAKEEGEEKSRGVIPQMPSCVVWAEPSGKVVANLIHPRTEQIFAVKGKGVNGTMGTLGDEGYPLSGLRADGPKWLAKFIPADVKVLGYASVLGFPLPPQTP